MTVRRALTTAVLALAAWCVVAPASSAASASVATASVGTASAPTASAAAISWRGCFGDLECGRLRVPLDRAGAVPGTVSLRVARGAFAGPRAEHLMYLSGGPGGAGIIEMIDVLLTVPSLLDRFNVIGFDQRGTGASGLLRCRAIERDARLRSTAAGAACAGRSRSASRAASSPGGAPST